MAEDFDREKVFEAACRLVRQRMRGGSSDAVKQTARLQNLLLRRGFDYDFVREVLSKTIAGARTAEDAECTDAL
jgi:SOS response regulatory protein OraA/RecX